jgi:hypothetical protein
MFIVGGEFLCTYLRSRMRFNAHTASFKIDRNHDLLISLFIIEFDISIMPSGCAVLLQRPQLFIFYNAVGCCDPLIRDSPTVLCR